MTKPKVTDALPKGVDRRCLEKKIIINARKASRNMMIFLAIHIFGLDEVLDTTSFSSAI